MSAKMLLKIFFCVIYSFTAMVLKENHKSCACRLLQILGTRLHIAQPASCYMRRMRRRMRRMRMKMKRRRMGRRKRRLMRRRRGRMMERMRRVRTEV